VAEEVPVSRALRRAVFGGDGDLETPTFPCPEPWLVLDAGGATAFLARSTEGSEEPRLIPALRMSALFLGVGVAALEFPSVELGLALRGPAGTLPTLEPLALALRRPRGLRDVSPAEINLSPPLPAERPLAPLVAPPAVIMATAAAVAPLMGSLPAAAVAAAPAAAASATERPTPLGELEATRGDDLG